MENDAKQKTDSALSLVQTQLATTHKLESSWGGVGGNALSRLFIQCCCWSVLIPTYHDVCRIELELSKKL